jgi:hypothetical protein
MNDETVSSDFNENIASLCAEGSIDELFESAYGMLSVAVHRCRSLGGDALLDGAEQIELVIRLLSQDGIDLLTRFKKEELSNADSTT